MVDPFEINTTTSDKGRVNVSLPAGSPVPFHEHDPTGMKLYQLARNNVILLLCLVALLLLFPLFRTNNPLARDLLRTAIFFCGIFSLDFSPRSLNLSRSTAILIAMLVGKFLARSGGN